MHHAKRINSISLSFPVEWWNSSLGFNITVWIIQQSPCLFAERQKANKKQQAPAEIMGRGAYRLIYIITHIRDAEALSGLLHELVWNTKADLFWSLPILGLFCIGQQNCWYYFGIMQKAEKCIIHHIKILISDLCIKCSQAVHHLIGD